MTHSAFKADLPVSLGLACVRGPLSVLERVALLVIMGLSLPSSAAALDPVALAQSRHCLSCHALDHKVVGPAYLEVAKKYQNDPNALAKLSLKVRLGGGGVWGAVPMPANAAVSELEAQELVKWILKMPSKP
jgi:cytochrome c